mmetsp:Transcript_4890/g.12137  ORF Transcript_4890/g.12137 Transcript_4890/m.12137 type:complete len:749 (+) Transcript_4890:181-2427(+)
MESDLTARVYAACDQSSIDFCCTQEDLTDLEQEIAFRIDSLHESERGAREDLTAIQAVVQLQVVFCEFDACLGERKYEKCADHYKKAKAIMAQHVSCERPAAILRHVVPQLEVQFRQRGVLFSSRMERNFHHIFSFLPNTICINKSDKNQKVWEGLKTMDLLDAKTRWLCEKIHKHVLAPLFGDARGKKLSARIFNPHDEVTVWSFVDENEPLDASEAGLEFLLGVLGSMIGYLRDFVAHRDALDSLGRYVWPLIVDFLRDFSLSDLSSARALEHGLHPSSDPQLLLNFQKKAVELQFISKHDHSLGTVAAERKTGVQARAKILEDARNWMVSQDMTTKQVAAVDASPMMAGIDKDLCQYLFNSCSVSMSTVKLVDEVRNSVLLGIRDPSQTKDQQMLTRQLVTLFLLVRPHVHRGKLTEDPFSCGIFYNDCTYFAFQLTILPFEYGSNRPIAWLVDVLPSLRRLGQAHLVALLKHLRKTLADKCAALKTFLVAVSEDAHYAAAEAILSGSLQHLRTALSSFAAVLPQKLLASVTTMLTEQFLEVLLRSFLLASTPGPGDSAAFRTANPNYEQTLFGGGASSPGGLLGGTVNLNAPRISDEHNDSSVGVFFGTTSSGAGGSGDNKSSNHVRWTETTARHNYMQVEGAGGGGGRDNPNFRSGDQQAQVNRDAAAEMADRNCISYLFSSVRVQVESLLCAQNANASSGEGKCCFDVMGMLIPILENDDMLYDDVKQQLHEALSMVDNGIR